MHPRDPFSGPLPLTGWLLLAAPLSAQSRAADSLWAAGEYAAAGVEYQRALHDNPGWVRALYRLAILASWDGRLDSAHALLADARELEPDEIAVRAYQAKMYAWQGLYRAAVLRYDSLLDDNGVYREARFGRAQAYAWWGRHEDAEREFRALVAYDPDDAEALVALAQLRQWQGRPDEASQFAARALRIAPEDRAAREIARQARALSRPRLELTLGFGHDSDDNNSAWQTLGTSFIAADGFRVFGSVGAFEASDPFQDGTRLSGRGRRLLAPWQPGGDRRAGRAPAGLRLRDRPLARHLARERLAPALAQCRSRDRLRPQQLRRDGAAAGAATSTWTSSPPKRISTSAIRPRSAPVPAWVTCPTITSAARWSWP